MSSSETRVRFNPISLITHITSSFTQVPTSEPQLYHPQNDADVEAARAPDTPDCPYDGDVESPDSFTQSQPDFPPPKRTRTRHKSEASPRRATQSDSAMAEPAPPEDAEDRRRRHSSSNSEKHIIRHTRKRRISGLSYQNADLCGQIQVMCGVISFIIELMLIIHFDLPHHFAGLGILAGIFYLLGGALGLSSAHSKQYKSIVLCMVMSALSVIMAIYVAAGALNGLLSLSHGTFPVEAEPPPAFDDDLVPIDYDPGFKGQGPGEDYLDHMDYDLPPHGDPYGVDDEGATTTVESADLTISRLLYVLMMIISAIEMVAAAAQAVICCSATCCKKYCFRRYQTATTVIYNTKCPERRETQGLVHKDVLERGDSSELQCDDSSCHSVDEVDVECDEIFVIPGVHLDNKATEDNHRAMEEYEVDEKGKKKKKRKK